MSERAAKHTSKKVMRTPKSNAPLFKKKKNRKNGTSLPMPKVLPITSAATSELLTSLISKQRKWTSNLKFRVAHHPKAQSPSSDRIRLFTDGIANNAYAEKHRERNRFNRLNLKRCMLGINTSTPSLPPLHVFFQRYDLIKRTQSLVKADIQMTTYKPPLQAIHRYYPASVSHIRRIPMELPDTFNIFLKSYHRKAMPEPTPSTKHEYQDLIDQYRDLFNLFTEVTKKTTMSQDNFKNKPPVFFNGSPTISRIQGVPYPCTILPITNLTIVDTRHGFRYPLDDTCVDDVILLPRNFIIQSQPHQQDLLDALDACEYKTQLTLVRGTRRIIAYQTKGAKYITPGIYAKRNGQGWEQKLLNKLTHQQWNTLYKYVNNLEGKAMSYMSPSILKGVDIARKFVPYPTFPSPDGKKESKLSASLAAGRDICLNCHTDDDSMYGIISPIDCDTARFEFDSDICCYFAFPEFGFAVALRPGDVLVFNPRTNHCVSSRVNQSQHLWLTSLYLKSAVVGGNDNSVALDPIQSELQHLYQQK